VSGLYAATCLLLIPCARPLPAPSFAMSSRPPVDQEPLHRTPDVASSFLDFTPTGRPPLSLRPSTLLCSSTAPPPQLRLLPTGVPRPFIQSPTARSLPLLLAPESPVLWTPISPPPPAGPATAPLRLPSMFMGPLWICFEGKSQASPDLLCCVVASKASCDFVIICYAV
jgi:hypothetical protein